MSTVFFAWQPFNAVAPELFLSRLPRGEQKTLEILPKLPK